MIPFDFEYYRPESISEAVQLFIELDQAGKNPVYFSGGTEIITLGRINVLYTNAVIDIKGIPECQVMDYHEGNLYLGSCCTLVDIEEKNLFPLLTATSKEVADHTARTKITLGGNICANLFYREAVLPFLLADSQVIIAGPNGYRTEYINQVFNQTLQLERGEFLVQLITEPDKIEAPSINIKRRRQWTTGYPLVTVAGLKLGEEIRVAISGLCPYPFRSQKMEYYINSQDFSQRDRIEKALGDVDGNVLNDTEGSDKYRLFILRNTMLDIVSTLEGERA
ncbi:MULTISPECIES: FAD binding domain-containing protein [Bacillaceae]|uniref:FAD binding domain-containing protein n=1 Tax=Evansella alkalicola TaxID=745819 RepID=A0ABS6JY92_9BACI|nr:MULTISPECIES: FAD binding domain-containing protein [Bacillaceae]MBU9722070.1 FAD binding domain-containing protein [Bacillus alkalicola]